MFMHPKLEKEAENIASAYVFFVVSIDNFLFSNFTGPPGRPAALYPLQRYFFAPSLEHGLAW